MRKSGSRSRISAATAILLSFLAFPGLTYGAPVSATPITFENALHEPTPQISELAWLNSTTLIAARKLTSTIATEIVTWSVATGRRTILGDGEYPSVSPDGRRLIFRDPESSQWMLRELASGTTISIQPGRKSTDVVFQAPQWSRDSRYVSICENHNSYVSEIKGNSDQVGSVNDHAGPNGSGGVRVVDVGALADSRSPAFFQYHATVTIVDAHFPQKPRVISMPEAVYNAGWGRRHELIIVAMNFSSPRYTAIEHINGDNLMRRTLWRLEGAIMQGTVPMVSPDGGTIALAIDVDGRRWEDYQSLVLLDAKNGTMRRVTRSLYVSEIQWRADSRSMVIVARHGGLFRLRAVDLAGRVKEVATGRRRYFDVHISPDGKRLAYQTRDGYGRRDLRISALDGTQESVVELQSDPTQRYRLGDFDQVQYPTSDGLQLFAFLVLPPNFDPKRRYPLIVDVHGGGAGQYLYLSGPLALRGNSEGTPLEWHAWAALGYVVFVPDYRSSGEYGPEIAAQRYRDSDTDGVLHDARDVADAARWIMHKDFIDVQRMAIIGHSAGGCRVNNLLTHTQLFAAAVISEPCASGRIAQVLGLTTGPNAGVRFEDFDWSSSAATNGVRFADNPAAFLSGFLFDGYKSKTPTLILVGNEAKGGIGSISPEVLFSMLRQYGVPTRMLRYLDDGHVPRDDLSAVHRFNEIRRWLDNYLPPIRSG